MGKIGSGEGAVRAQGGLVKKGLAVGRFCHDAETRSKFDAEDGSPKFNYQWDVELFNPDGENAWVLVWTNQTLHPKGNLFLFADAIFDGDVPVVEDTEELYGKPFSIRVEVVEKDGVQYNRAYKPYTLMPFEGENPFDTEPADAYAAAVAEDAEASRPVAADDSDDIPF